MFGKCRYLDEITGGRGVIFATGTPLSNQHDRDVHPHALPSVQHLAAERVDPFSTHGIDFWRNYYAIELAPEGYT